MEANGKHIDTDELLVKYITGEAGATEELQVSQWIDADAENKRYYDHFKQIWGESLGLANTNIVDENAAWERFNVRMGNVATIKQINYRRWFAVAAVALLTTTAILFAINRLKRTDQTSRPMAVSTAKPKEPHILRFAATDMVRTDTLPDGSAITLNKNATLSYPATFSAKTRMVELIGEAFFNVRHDSKRPFVIKVNDVRIVVLGTSFNVKSNHKKVEVIVETGLVSVQRKELSAILHPRQKLTVTDTATSFNAGRVANQGYRKYFDKPMKRDTERPAKKGDLFHVVKDQ